MGLVDNVFSILDSGYSILDTGFYIFDSSCLRFDDRYSFKEPQITNSLPLLAKEEGFGHSHQVKIVTD